MGLNDKSFVVFLFLILSCGLSVMIKAAEEPRKKEIDLLVQREELRRDRALLEENINAQPVVQDERIEKLLKGTEKTIAEMKKKNLDVGDLELRLARTRMMHHIAGPEDYRIYEKYLEQKCKQLEADIAQKEEALAATQASKAHAKMKMSIARHKHGIMPVSEEPVKIIKTHSSDMLTFSTAFQSFLWDKMQAVNKSSSLSEAKQIAWRAFYADLMTRSAGHAFFQAHDGVAISEELQQDHWNVGSELPKTVRLKFAKIVRGLAQKERPGIL